MNDHHLTKTKSIAKRNLPSSLEHYRSILGINEQ